jgi:hypothetical protein
MGASKLEGDRMFDRIKAEKTPAVAPEDRVGDDHFGIKPGMAAQQAMEPPAMTVRPVHHWSDAESPGGVYDFHASQPFFARRSTISVPFRQSWAPAPADRAVINAPEFLPKTAIRPRNNTTASGID